MTPRRLTDAALLASIREATAAWHAAQDTEYYAGKHRLERSGMHKRLLALEAAGLVTRSRRRMFGSLADFWEVRETP